MYLQTKKKVHNIDNYDAIQITPNNLLGVLVGQLQDQ